MLLPVGLRADGIECNRNDQTPAVHITKNDMTTECVNITFTQMYRMMHRHDDDDDEIYKDVLFADNRVNSYTIQEILNRCIEKGIFSV